MVLAAYVTLTEATMAAAAMINFFFMMMLVLCLVLVVPGNPGRLDRQAPSSGPAGWNC